MGTLSLTGLANLRTPFEPLLYGYLHVPPPYCYRCSFGLKYPDCGVECAKFVEETLKWEDPQTVAAFVGEPVLGSTFIVPPKEYWKIVREICDKYGVVLIFDEVMSGFGRTGKMFGCENYDVIPDIMASGKGITSGHLPLGAVVFNKEIGDRLSEEHFPHGYTYASHPTCCAAGLAGIQVVQEEGLVQNSANVGGHLLKRLKELHNRHRCVGDARGLGLFCAIELVKDKKTKEPLLDPHSGENATSYVRRRAKERGLLVGTTTFAPSVIRLSPPLCITKEETDWAVDSLEEILSEVDSKM